MPDIVASQTPDGDILLYFNQPDDAEATWTRMLAFFTETV